MAMFGAKTSALGLDLGSSSVKLVELVDRRRRLEVATYGSANFPNILTNLAKNDDEAVNETVKIVKDLMQQAESSSDTIVAALPSSSVFSSVIKVPKVASDIDKAVRTAAQEVVPAEIDDLVLGWTKMFSEGDSISVYMTAAPKKIVERYKKVVAALQGELFALEVETFPLTRSLLAEVKGPSVIADIGSKTTTYHLIIKGTPRASHTATFGGQNLTQALVDGDGLSVEEAENVKKTAGVANEKLKTAAARFYEEEEKLIAMYGAGDALNNWTTTLIGGGASMPGLVSDWQKTKGRQVRVGNPWRGLSYPQNLEKRLTELGPTYAVAIGLALRVLQ